MDAKITSTWEDNYKICVAQIDVQHRMLLKLIDIIHEGVESRIEKSVLKDLLVKLAEFTRMHFWMEEQLMIEHEYPDFKRHHKEHRELLEHLNDLVDFVSNAKYPTFYSDYDISTDWALIHIAEQDNTFGEFLNDKGID